MKNYLAEMTGTMVLVLLGCGSAVFLGGAGTPAAVLAIAFAFGLSVVAMAYAIGPVSGCHINPAITLGIFLSGRMTGRDAGMYMLFQVIGAIIGSAVLWVIGRGYPITATATRANEWAVDTAWWTAFIAETVFTCVFVFVVLGAMSVKSPLGFAGLAIGLTLVLIHIVCIPITGTSVNPARSIGPALFEGGRTLSQLWLFILAPLLGGSLAAGLWRLIGAQLEITEEVTGI